MSFDFKTAIKLYKENPTKEVFNEVSQKLDNSYTVLAGTNSKNAKPVGVIEF